MKFKWNSLAKSGSTELPAVWRSCLPRTAGDGHIDGSLNQGCPCRASGLQVASTITLIWFYIDERRTSVKDFGREF
jgi:hypothetical protein